jgi:hypothetical protein
MTTTKELLQTLNALRTANGKTELASWKSSREKLEAAISELQPTAEPVSKPVASDLTDVEGQTETTDVEGQTETTDLTSDEPAPPAVQKSPRGAIGALVIELLVTDMPYEDIVERVRSTYPDARTTARSIASVAMDLRRDGVNVPSRRKPAAEKPAKAPKPAQEA